MSNNKKKSGRLPGSKNHTIEKAYALISALRADIKDLSGANITPEGVTSLESRFKCLLGIEGDLNQKNKLARLFDEKDQLKSRLFDVLTTIRLTVKQPLSNENLSLLSFGIVSKTDSEAQIITAVSRLLVEFEENAEQFTQVGLTETVKKELQEAYDAFFDVHNRVSELKKIRKVATIERNAEIETFILELKAYAIRAKIWFVHKGDSRADNYIFYKAKKKKDVETNQEAA